MMSTHFSEPHRPTAEQFILIDLLASMTAEFIERAYIETAIKENEEGKTFLLKLSDALRDIADSMEVQAIACRLLGEHLGVNQVHYGETAGDVVVIYQGWGNGLPPMVGTFRHMDFGKRLVEGYRAGRVQISYNVDTDPNITESERKVIGGAGFHAYVAMPLVKDGEWVATLAAHSITPRNWKQHEIDLVQEVAERTWAAVERAKAEKELQESEERYRNEAARLHATLKSMGDAVYIGDASGITLANQPALDQLGYSNYEELNRNIGALSVEIQTRDALTNEVIPPEEQAFAQALTGEYVTKNVRIRQLKSGSERIVRSAASPVIVDGKVVAAVAINTDITEQWVTEAALRKSEEKLREFNNTLEQEVKKRTAELQENHRLLESIYNTTHVGISVLKPVYNEQNEITDFDIVSVNKRMVDASGRKDLTGKLYAKEFPGIKKMGLFDTMVKAMKGGEQSQIEYYYGYDNINKWYSTMCVRNGDMLVCSNMDMTEQKQAEERNREFDKRQKELEEWQKQQIFRTILDTQEEERKRIAENLHNSLGQILYGTKLSLSQVLKADLNENDKESLKNVDKLLNDAITESRRLSHELMPVILEDFGLKTAIEDICRQFSGNINFKCRFSGLNKRLDRYIEIAIYRIVQEIMMNIVKHSGATEALVALELKKAHILVLIQDNGVGFDLQRKKRDGIGLKTIRNKVSLLNGNINIISSPGNGMITNIDIPVKN